MLKELFQFTPIQASIVIHIARGLSCDETAVEMGASPNTVKSHLQLIYRKVGVSSQSELVRVALNSVSSLG